MHDGQEWESRYDDILRERPRGLERGVDGIGIKSQAKPPIFFARIFFMNSLTDELLGKKQDKFKVGDLVKTTASTSPVRTKPWLGVVTSVTVLKNKEGETKNLYTVDWIEVEAKEILWYDWYDGDLTLVQSSADC